ncbi:MAG: hypothetical protein AUH85_02660 [Chloroflexi bacterium 13_1_40CM_4_68_4]|nr:MAG: hypothetical protein AUH85_02660 [Chloroflexi bacterium 13_1_40CM_4_68_4]
MRAPIWLITGIPGAGKTSVCAELASRYVVGLHLETDIVDELRLHLSGEMDRPIQRLVFRRGVALMSAEFAMSGVAVVIDDTLETDEERRAYTDRLKKVRLVHLLPPLEVALARNATRVADAGGAHRRSRLVRARQRWAGRRRHRRCPHRAFRPRGTRGLTVAYASWMMRAISCHDRSRSSLTPSQPRCDTYGGTKKCSGRASASVRCAPGGAAHQSARRPSPWWSSMKVTNERFSRMKNVGAP